MENYKPKSKGARRIAIEIEKGITDPKEIAENTGYKLSTVLQYLSLYFPTERVRSTKRKGKMISEKTKLIIERLENGELQSNIAREFGVTRQRVYRIRKNFVDTKEEVQNEKDTINGLRCLAGERQCDLCKYDDMAMNDGERTCINFVAEDALDLIHRLQGVNERIQEISKEKSKDYYAVAQTCALQEETIAKQKAEIERLTKKDNEKNERSPFLMCEDYDAYLESMSKTELLEYFHFVMGNYKQSFDKVTLENTELQKQVDELKNAYNDLLETCRNCDTTQAEKDTAREIFQELYNETIKDGIPAVYCMLTPKEIKDRAKRYGVEVE